jgi:hypothetical protein
MGIGPVISKYNLSGNAGRSAPCIDYTQGTEVAASSQLRIPYIVGYAPVVTLAVCPTGRDSRGSLASPALS